MRDHTINLHAGRICKSRGFEVAHTLLSAAWPVPRKILSIRGGRVQLTYVREAGVRVTVWRKTLPSDVRRTTTARIRTNVGRAVRHLRECPSCSCREVRVRGRHRFRVLCTGCGMCSGYRVTADEAVEAWNRRAGEGVARVA